ncbi:MAG: ferrochelatase [Gammaproteobacteria bacterium]|nr:ferrochelatase [Gammaproteobacteria bacterium]MDE2349793.1 ferrochelatase [Gammaproteobacteria bacterium]
MAYYRAVAQPAASTPERIGVLVVNLGTPDSPSYFAVRRYLREFLGDRRVIDTSRLLWLPLLYGIILPLRPLRTARNYRKVWMKDGSPLAVYSGRLAAKIDARLRATEGDRVRTVLAMTYGNPSLEDGIRALAEQNVRRLLVLPLYPQYCSSTTGSVFDGVARVLRRWRWLPETRFVNDYFDDPGYIDALTAQIENHWAATGGRTHLMLSYHGIPAVYVAEGDPYQAQAEATTRLVVERLGLKDTEWSHCYQSRFGSVVWLQPYTEDTLKALAKRGIRRLTVVSPSFAVDCLETLEEVAMEYQGQFLALGGERFGMVPALNDEDRHADLLAGLVTRQIQGWV